MIHGEPMNANSPRPSSCPDTLVVPAAIMSGIFEHDRIVACLPLLSRIPRSCAYAY